MRSAIARELFIELRHLRQSAAEDDDVGVEQVDDAGQRPPETARVAIEGGRTGGIAGRRLVGDVGGSEGDSGMALMVGCQARPR